MPSRRLLWWYECPGVLYFDTQISSCVNVPFYIHVFLYLIFVDKIKHLHMGPQRYLVKSVMDMAQPLKVSPNFRGTSAIVSIFSIRAWTHPLLQSPHKSACVHLLIVSSPSMMSHMTSLIPHYIITTHVE